MTLYDNYSVDDDLAFKPLSVCQFLHISRRTFYRWTKSGKVSSRKMDGEWITPLMEINRLRLLKGLTELSKEEALRLFEVFNG